MAGYEWIARYIIFYHRWELSPARTRCFNQVFLSLQVDEGASIVLEVEATNEPFIDWF